MRMSCPPDGKTDDFSRIPTYRTDRASIIPDGASGSVFSKGKKDESA